MCSNETGLLSGLNPKIEERRPRLRQGIIHVTQDDNRGTRFNLIGAAHPIANHFELLLVLRCLGYDRTKEMQH